MPKHLKTLLAATCVAIATTFTSSVLAITPIKQTSTGLAVPTGLASAITNLDNAANNRDLPGVMQFYVSEFTHGDGLTKQKLRESVEILWQRYKDLQYRTEISKIETKGDTFKVETITRIKGTQGKGESQFKLLAEVTSVLTYQSKDQSKDQNKAENWQILRQDIISEKSSLVSGEKPPTVELRLPENIGIGRQYALDAIVTEPLGASLLLGAVIEEKVNPANYIKDAAIELEALSSGGIFKIGQAPYSEGDRWISVILVRENGVTINSQRLRVSKNFVGGQYTPLPETGSIRIKVPNQTKKQTSL